MKKLLIIFILFNLTSCKWSNAYLGDNYYYLDMDEAKDVGYPDGAIIYKSTERYLFSDIKIKGNVIEVKSNDKFIVAKQIPINQKKINYYIINKSKDQVYGPHNADSIRVLIKKFKIDLKI